MMTNTDTTPSAAKRRRGLTLVEVMVAMVVLAFGLLGVAAMQVRAMQGGSSGMHLAEASGLARNRVELLTRLRWSDADLASTGGAWRAVGPATTASMTFQQRERITDLSGDVKRIEVQVLWDEALRPSRSVVFSSSRLRGVME